MAILTKSNDSSPQPVQMDLIKLETVIEAEDEAWHGKPDSAQWVQRAIQNTCDFLFQQWLESRTDTAYKTRRQPRFTASQSYEIDVVLGSDHYSCQLNQQWRGENQATNVLSFPTELVHLELPTIKSLAATMPLVMLGDIYFAYGTIAREAAEQSKNFYHHLSHLAVHGTLHLLGYDHIIESEAEQMESLEILILANMAIANPYQIELDTFLSKSVNITTRTGVGS